MEELTLIVGGNTIGGWQDIDVTLLAEGFPNQFSIALSSKNPITSDAVVVAANDPCRVLLGSDTVITGYVDRDSIAFSPDAHMLTIIGRGRTRDLVDCSAEYGAGAITNASALDVAQKLCGVYPGLTARLAPDTDVGARIDQLLIDYTETGAAIIQRVTRNAGLLAYEDFQGRLTLARAGTRTAASGAVYGVNVLACSIQSSMDQRYSEIVCSSVSQDMLIGVEPLDEKGSFFHTEQDPGVVMHRRLVILMEQAESPEDFTILKAKWEVSRRAGRSTSVTLTLDSWRDHDGKLWEPNTLIPVRLPGLRLPDQNLIISEVTFHRSDERGTVADLSLLPKAAFDIEPINLVPVNQQGVVTPNLSDAG